LGVAGLIFLASSRSRIATPEFFLPVDKVGHFGVYGLLGTLVCRLGQGWRAAGWAFFVCSLYGVSDEWHQSFVPGRSVEFADWLADTLGAALAVALYTGWGSYRRGLETSLWGRKRAVPAMPAVQ